MRHHTHPLSFASLLGWECCEPQSVLESKDGKRSMSELKLMHVIVFHPLLAKQGQGPPEELRSESCFCGCKTSWTKNICALPQNVWVVASKI